MQPVTTSTSYFDGTTARFAATSAANLAARIDDMTLEGTALVDSVACDSARVCSESEKKLRAAIDTFYQVRVPSKALNMQRLFKITCAKLDEWLGSNIIKT